MGIFAWRRYAKGRSNMKVDVVLLTFNSVKPVLPECLQSLKREVPVNRLIVVDGGSTDATLDVCQEYFPNCEIINDVDGNRATSRQKGIESVKTDWFLFLDADVILHAQWFSEAVQSINPKVGAVQGAIIQRIDPVIHDFDYAMRRLRKMFGGLTYKPLLAPTDRGFTGDVLVRASLVKDIYIPKLLHHWEDHYVKRWIENKNYLWVRCSTALCDHYMIDRSAKASYYGSFIGYFIGYLTVKSSLIAMATIFPKILFALCLKPNLKMAWWQLKFQFWSTIGALKAYFANPRTEIKKAFEFKVGARKEEIEGSRPDYVRID